VISGRELADVRARVGVDGVAYSGSHGFDMTDQSGVPIGGERWAQFDATLEMLVARHGVAYHDFASVSNDEALFFDSDHLNQDGVERFFENHLREVLIDGRGE
ncbi:MAG: trehalose-phosphatase, partial [Vicinamibacterales bacterium]|nr:trehalose-phosphatase [Vicinamibacterales bacterium]